MWLFASLRDFTQNVSIFSLIVDLTECLNLTNDTNVCWLFVNDESQTWSDASQYCEELGGFLAVEHDTSLGNVIRQQLSTYRWNREYWLGLRRHGGQTSFIWVNGTVRFKAEAQLYQLEQPFMMLNRIMVRK